MWNAGFPGGRRHGEMEKSLRQSGKRGSRRDLGQTADGNPNSGALSLQNSRQLGNLVKPAFGKVRRVSEYRSQVRSAAV